MHKDTFEELSTNHESFRKHLIKLEQNNNHNNHNLSFFGLLLLSGLATVEQSTNNHNNHNKKNLNYRNELAHCILIQRSQVIV